MGIMAAGFMLLVAVTGVLLNHTEYFQFDSQHVKSDDVLDWYGIKAPDDLLSFVTNERYITLMGEHLYIGELEAPGEYKKLIGTVSSNGMLIIAADDQILLMTPAGEMIERLDEKDGVPAGMKRVGVDQSGLFVIESGIDLYTSKDDFLSWQHWAGDKTEIRWATPAATGNALKKMLQYHYRGEVLPVERVLLDLHSGRFFGPLGPWLIDASAVLLALLSLTGTWMWIKRRR
jgi:hypothetical protein